MTLTRDRSRREAPDPERPSGPTSVVERSRQLRPGDTFRPHRLETVDGAVITVPDPERVVHLQLRRFAGCPVCNLHLRSVVARLDEIEAAGVREVVVFHSSADELRPHVEDLPVDAIADPDKALYREVGAEASKRSLFHPRAWPAIGRGLVAATATSVRGGAPMPPFFPAGGRYGLPADLLLAPDGRILATHYGRHADDQWSVDDLLEVAADAR